MTNNSDFDFGNYPFSLPVHFALFVSHFYGAGLVMDGS